MNDHDSRFDRPPVGDRLRALLAERPVIGPFSKTCDPGMVEAMGIGGFDFCILDAEHGPCGWETMGRLILAAEARGMAPIVRVPGLSAEGIGKALDLGAAGVQVPQVATPDDVKQAVAAGRFAPRGQRGVCRYVRAADYSAKGRDAYFQTANERLLIVQLEGREALDNLDAIIAVGGFDIVFVGPYDLSQSMNLTGQVDHPKVIEAMANVVERCRAAGLIVGTFVESQTDVQRWRDAGCRYLCYSVDVGLFVDACAAVVREAGLNQGGAA